MLFDPAPVLLDPTTNQHPMLPIASPSKSRARLGRVKPRRRRLLVEQLEDRRVLASFVVNHLGDTPDANPGDGFAADALGNATLRAAFEEANALAGLDEISFAVTGNVPLTLGSLILSDDVQVLGPGADQLTIDAQLNSRVLEVTSGTAEIHGLTLTGGNRVSDGAGIYNSGTLTLTSSTVSGNFADEGGGIYNFGNLTLASSTVSGNNSSLGGGIFNRGTLILAGSTVSGNNSSLGGGIFNRGTLILAGSTVSGNTAFFSGGGIHNDYGSALTLNSSTVSGNIATTDNANGGGIFNRGTSTLTSSTVSGNNASDGGGIFNSGGTLTLNSSTVSGNTAQTDGGGIHNLNFSLLTVEQSIVAGNIAMVQAPDLRVGQQAVGFPIVVNYSLIGNTAGSGIGPTTGLGNVLNQDPLLTPLGAFGGPTLTHALLTGSPAIDMGDPNAAGLPLSDQRGAPFVRVFNGRVDIGAFELQPAPFPLIVDTLADEVDDDISPGEFSLREAIALANLSPIAETISFDAGLSGGVITLGGTELLITNSLTIDATSLAQPVTVDAGQQSRVMHFSASTGDLTLGGLNITGGQTSNAGGGILFNSAGSLTIMRSSIANNATSLSGGGIQAFLGDVTLIESTVSGNSSGDDGGGIFVGTGALHLSSSTVSGNRTSGLNAQGGGIWSFSGTVTLSHSTVTANSSADDGGGIFVLDSPSNPLITISHSIVADNMATGSGPDLLLDPDAGQDVNYSLIGNTAGSGIGPTTGNGNVLNQDPLLTPLGAFGGPTLTHALRTGSPAIDMGDPNAAAGVAGVPLFDQRGDGFDRVVDGRIDIGAIETQPLELVVDTLTDESDGDYSTGDLSLREALEISNATPDNATITFADGLTGSIFLVLGQLAITDDVTVDGPGADQLTISGDQASRVFAVSDGLTRIEGLTITGGSSSFGSGIFNDGAAVALSEVTITGNTATFGGGIFNVRGTLHVDSSTVSDNSAGNNGGGIWSETNLSGTQALTVTNSTISGNTAGFNGGGIFNFSGLTTIQYSTVTQNQAGTSGDGVWSYGDSSTRTEVRSSIIAGNGGGQDLQYNNSDNSFVSLDYNLVGGGNASGEFVETGDQNGVTDPMLGPLADNGGPTPTHLPQAGSAAIDLGDPAATGGAGGVPLFDQRGDDFDRVSGGRIDIGAVEMQVVLVDSADFDEDGDIDGRDFLLWQRGFGTTSATKLDGDADNDMEVDGDDLTIWQAQFGQQTPVAALSAAYNDSADQAMEQPLDASLVDAAMALEWIDGSTGTEDSSVVIEEEMELFMTPQLRDASIAQGTSTISSTSDADSSAASDEADSTQESWLTDEQLESVFG